jgi:hypothetical protein
VQLLIDDITYGVQVSPGYPNVPVYPCLWSAPEFTTTYEATGVWNFSAINPNWFTSFGIGFLPSGAAIVIDTESWSPFALYQRFGVEMWEADNVGNPVRRLDETNQMIHAAMYARMEHVPGAVTGDALGLNISETLATVSESRRYQTPHIIPNPNTLACVQNTISSYVSTQIFVKGRVVVNGADALTENGDMVVY